jgi:hypothetical protein
VKIVDILGETNSKIKNFRDLYMGNSDFKKGCQSRTNIVTDSHPLRDLVGKRLPRYFRWMEEPFLSAIEYTRG